MEDDEIQALADAVAGLSDYDRQTLVNMLNLSDVNVNKVGITTNGDPVPPDPTHPHPPTNP